MRKKAADRVGNAPRDPVTGIRKHPLKLRCGIGNCLRFVSSLSLRPAGRSPVLASDRMHSARANRRRFKSKGTPSPTSLRSPRAPSTRAHTTPAVSDARCLVSLRPRRGPSSPLQPAASERADPRRADAPPVSALQLLVRAEAGPQPPHAAQLCALCTLIDDALRGAED